MSQIAPFLLPAILFQSAIFAFISPLPLFISTMRNPLLLSALALLSNAAVVLLGGDPHEAVIAIFFWFGVGIFFPLLIRKTGRIQFSFTISYTYLVGVMVAALSYLALKAGMHPVDFVRAEISMGIDHLVAIPESPVKKMIEEQGRDALLKQLFTELPSGALIALLISFWINLLFASQMMRGFLSAKFWAEFRNPEWLVWPAIGFGALYAFTEHAPYYFGLTGFKVIMVFYAFQGLSVISFLLNRFKILGFGRALIFSVAIFLALPLVFSLGFFDLWFDFRRKFGQS